MLLSALAAGILTAEPQQPGQPKPAARGDNPGPRELLVFAVTQESEGPLIRLRGAAEVRSTEMVIRADQIDYNQETHDAEARGNVRFEHFISGETLQADRAEYNLETEMGRFYAISGTAHGKIDYRPGLLISPNPFTFQARWAERIKEKYILHDGMITNCRLPKPWWTLRGPKFDVIPGDRALAYHSVFRVRKIPIFYTPFFYKALEELPRKSGFLTPNMGNSSRRGKMLGVGYYWAINRSYDFTYRNQFFTQRGFAHHIDFRGKPAETSDFNLVFFGVNDRGLKLDTGQRLDPASGYQFELDGRHYVGKGFQARGSVNYLSSLRFRQEFTESFNEAIYNEVQSIGFIGKSWSSFSFNSVFSRKEMFQSAAEGDKITIRKLPSFELSMRDRPVFKGDLPLWVSLESSAGFVRRNQPLYQTRQYVDRLDFAPRVMTAFHWKGFHLIPALTLRETHYGESREGDVIIGHNLNRTSTEFTTDLLIPSLARVFKPPRWFARLFAADELKHVIEPSAAFRHAGGVSDFNRLIRFDELEVISNTTEAEISIVNRLYAKRQGVVSEVLSWQVWQRRYFDPDFGGAVVEGRRNVVHSQTTLTAYSFLDGPRRYSPIVSILRTAPTHRMVLEWRADYDPLRKRIVNSTLASDARFSNYFIGLGHNQVRSNPVISPSANQLLIRGGYGAEGRRGWSTGFNGIYDFREGIMQFALTQVSYNTDCCGLSIQFRRISAGFRNENQFLLSFAIANIGSFGTLKKQERLF